MVFYILILAVTVSLSLPLGKCMASIMNPLLRQGSLHCKLENILLKVGGRTLTEDQNWKKYCLSLLFFNAIMFILVFLLLSFQQYLPLNPDKKGALEPSLIFHTTASFVSNTNQQHYSGEVSLSYFSQLFGLMWLQFVSAGTGLAALAALARGVSGKSKMGNFYRDLLRATLFILLPFSILVGSILVISGVPMTLKGAATAVTLEGPIQTISRGPVAAFAAIKQLGTNGGGFFGPNSTHPFENPSFFTNIVECICILLIPMACVWMFGRITGRMRHATVIFAVMTALFLCKVSLAVWFEKAPNASFAGLTVELVKENLEGKELRFGASSAPIWASATTATSNGSVNCMHNSLNPLTLLIPFTGMWLNCIFGGNGVGFINMFLYIILGVFICGMMVGRTPEYLSRKVETREMKLALLALLVHPFFILSGTALFSSTPWGTETVKNPGAIGFSEIMYEFTSASANNGSGLEGLSDNTVAWNISTGAIMLLARFIPIILPLAIAGFLSVKKPTPETKGTLRTDNLLFGIILIGTIILLGALLFMPFAVLGPIVEYLKTTA